MAGFLATLFGVIQRMRAKKPLTPKERAAVRQEEARRAKRQEKREQARKPPPGPPRPPVQPPPGLTPDDAEFLLELGVPLEEFEAEWEKPYQIPKIGLTPAPPASAMAAIMDGGWISVASSNVDSFRYNESGDWIDVQFLSGSMYRYYNCTTNDAMQFYMSPSAGRYVWYVLRKGETRKPDGTWNPGSAHPFRKLREPNRTSHVNPRTGKGFIIFGPRKKWKYRSKSTGRAKRMPRRPWPG